jgi:CheY-like chemotaxis protein
LVAGERQRLFLEREAPAGVVPLCMPLTASRITGALRRVAGADKGQDESESFPDGNVVFKGRALVAEDAPVNQKLIRLMLERLGLAVSIAGDGIEAVKMFRDCGFDIVFMDISMPVLDGIEATSRIRAIEKEERRAHTPIVALTAHAVKGERERLLAAGMDEYLSKPVDMDSLRRVAGLYLGGSASGGGNEPDGQVFELEKTARDLGIERHELEGLIDDFLSSSEEYLGLLEESMGAETPDGMRLAAHRLKGVASNYRLKRLSELSGKLEEAVECGNGSVFKRLVEGIRGEMERLRKLLQAR